MYYVTTLTLTIGQQVAAEFVAHVVALFVGCYVRFLMDITNKKSFLERRDLLKTKCKLNLEKVRADLPA